FGLIISFIITFTLLPTLLNFVPTKTISVNDEGGSKITKFFGNLSLNYQIPILIITVFVIGLSILGVSKLEVENSF